MYVRFNSTKMFLYLRHASIEKEIDMHGTCNTRWFRYGTGHSAANCSDSKSVANE